MSHPPLEYKLTIQNARTGEVIPGYFVEGDTFDECWSKVRRAAGDDHRYMVLLSAELLVFDDKTAQPLMYEFATQDPSTGDVLARITVKGDTFDQCWQKVLDSLDCEDIATILSAKLIDPATYTYTPDKA